ncbi:translation initiation inhibitor [Halteromyces radiatus]|uniref:translation initiation inhibitor n=1 Tax=Halteromyces radiatus TaxID=101107 RepID=UPI00221F0BCD|nr:translation initiation inhibitor [Halteromyces radiatus]KAI8089148.1 translation initiation inhibitor [Halteromyces radiatus]
MASLIPITSPDAPQALGPYSHAVLVNGILYTSGQIGLEPATGNLVTGGIVEQTKQSLLNLRGVVESGGSKFDNVIKTTVFLKDMNDFAAMNGMYEQFFGEHKPARSCVEVARLPKDVLVEIECIALAGVTA